MRPAQRSGSRSLWLFLALLNGCAGAPGFMVSATEAGQRIARLGWWLTAAAIAVVLVVSGLLVAALRHHPTEPAGPEAAGRGTRWIHAGLAGTALILIVAFIASERTLDRTSAPPAPPRLTVRVVGHRWWWEVIYTDPATGKSFATANEMHLPIGAPVRIQLVSADVIHSFWIPELGGKTDLIPGQVNQTWLQARVAGTYRGQCAEYCGQQHARMALTLVAEPPEAFQAWQARQLLPAEPPGDTLAGKGRTVFANRCAVCHTVRGNGGGGVVGPDLTHIAGRLTLAAGTLPNTRGNLGGWIANPQVLKPGSLMPATGLSSDELLRVIAYLESLR